MHTKEPWKVGEFGGIYQATGGACIVSALTPSGFLPNSIANERRIVACVNACRPLTTESLEMQGLAGITSSTERILREQCDTAINERIAAGKRIEEMERQRDELETECAVHATCTKTRVEQLVAVTAQRDDLLEALKLCKFDSLNMSMEDLGFIRSVVAKVTQS